MFDIDYECDEFTEGHIVKNGTPMTSNEIVRDLQLIPKILRQMAYVSKTLDDSQKLHDERHDILNWLIELDNSIN